MTCSNEDHRRWQILCVGRGERGCQWPVLKRKENLRVQQVYKDTIFVVRAGYNVSWCLNFVWFGIIHVCNYNTYGAVVVYMHTNSFDTCICVCVD